jgi:hypothetical protein
MTRPSRLLKFAPEPRFLKNGMFRFTQPSALNDPHEAFPALLAEEYAPEDIEAARTKARNDGNSHFSDEMLINFYMTPWPFHRMDEKSFPGLWPWTDKRLRSQPFVTLAEHDLAVAERAVELAVNYANRTIGILSLSESADETMWAHYGDDHCGICTVFDPAHHFFQRNPFKPVVYSNRPIHVTVKHGWVRFGGHKLSKDSLLENQLDFYPDEILWRKRSTWSVEQEWRMVKLLSDADEIIEQGPNRLLVHLFRMPPEAILGVIFGLRASREKVKQTVESVAGDARWAHLFFRQRHKFPSGITEIDIIRQ